MKVKMMSYIMLSMLMLSALIAGCSGEVDLSQERLNMAKKNSGDIVIGVAWPFESRGDLFEEGIDLAVEEINAAGGILGNPLRLIKQDDESSVTLGLSIAQSFADNLDMVAVIGHRSSAVTVPAAAIYENAGLLMLTAASTAPNLTQLGYNYIFRSIPNDEQIGQKMSEYAVEEKYRNIAIFYKDDAYGRGLANAFEDQASKSGIQIIDRLSSYSDINDLQRIVEMWTILDVDAVFLADVMPAAAEFIVDLRRAGLDVPVIGGDGLDSADLAEIGGKAVEGTVVASVFNPNVTNEKTVKFIEVFSDKYNIEPNKWAAQGYDAVYLLADSIQAANSRVPMDIANEIVSMDAWVGVTGTHVFKRNGDVENKPIVKKIYRSGQFDYLDEGGN